MLKTTPKSDNFDESLWDTLQRTNFNISQQKFLSKNVRKLKLIISVRLSVEMEQMN